MMRPLVCELDSTLLKTDLRSEIRLQKIKQTLSRLLSSSTDLKNLQLQKNDHDDTSLEPPFNESVFDFLLVRKAAGQPLILCSRDDPASIAAILGERHIFDQIIERTADEQLPASLGPYDYIGNADSPMKMWQTAEKRYVVEASDKTEKLLLQNNIAVAKSFKAPDAGIKPIIKSLRTYQWLKNLLVFVPIITSQQLDNTTAIINSIIIFVCFSLVASFGYVVNDLLDLKSDRAHPVKFKRPFASGALTVRHGLIIGVSLLVLAIVGCSFLPLAAGAALGCYLILTVLYSLYLKTKLMIDVVALGGLFTLRVIGGAAAIETELSFYLLSFSIFIFSSLGMVKRFAELHNLQRLQKLTAQGRGYRVEDMAPVRIIGISLGYMSVFIMGQYINSPVVTQYYDNPKIIWFLFPLLTYWLGRLWILANRGEVNEDPLIFAMKDTTSLLVVATAAVILIIAN